MKLGMMFLALLSAAAPVFASEMEQMRSDITVLKQQLPTACAARGEDPARLALADGLVKKSSERVSHIRKQISALSGFLMDPVGTIERDRQVYFAKQRAAILEKIAVEQSQSAISARVGASLTSAAHQAQEGRLRSIASIVDQQEQSMAPSAHPELVDIAKQKALQDLKSYAALNDQFLDVRDAATFCVWKAAGKPGLTALPQKEDGRLNLDTPNPKLAAIEAADNAHEMRLRNLALGDGDGTVALPPQAQIPSGSGSAR